MPNRVGDYRATEDVEMSMNVHVANVFVICVTLLQAIGPASTSVPQVLDPATHREAYAIYATELPRPWVQLKGDLLLQQETERGNPCGLTKNQTGEWADVAKDFEEQNAHVWLLERALPQYFQYRLLRRSEIEALDAQVPGTNPGRPRALQYVTVSAVGFNHQRTKAMVYVHERLRGSFAMLELQDGRWQPVGETCTVVS